MKVDLGLLLLRVGYGTLLFSHGWPKIARLSANPVIFADPLGIGVKATLILAIFAEVICTALVVAGLATRLACIPIILTMLTAFGIVHRADPWAIKELSLLFALAFTVILLLGPGRLSLDAFFKARKHVNAYRA